MKTKANMKAKAPNVAMRRVVGFAGWVAAAAAVAWAVVVCCGQKEPPADTGKRPSYSARRHLIRSASRGAKAKEPGKAALKPDQPDGDDKFSISYKWDTSSLYGMLGNVPPETAAIAKRIDSAFKAKDFDGLMACVDDALKCRNPIVRAMMTSALRYYAESSTLPDDDAYDTMLQIGETGINNGWPKAGKDDLRRLEAVLPAVSLFLDDENATVGRFAAKAWIAGMRRMDAGETRLEATRDLFARGGDAVIDEFSRMNSLHIAAYCGLGNKSKAAWALMLSDAIERPINGDYEKVARSMYQQLMNEEYASRASTGQALEWMKNVEQYANERYTDPDDAATLMNFATGAGRDQFDERAREVFEEINPGFTTASAAIEAANEISKAEKVITERYGDGEEAQELLAKKIDEVIAEKKKYDKDLLNIRKMHKRK